MSELDIETATLLRLRVNASDLSESDKTELRGLIDAAQRSTKEAWGVEREDCEDGSITYHLWQLEPEYRWIIGLNDAEDRQGTGAKRYAEAIVKAMNGYASRTPTTTT